MDSWFTSAGARRPAAKRATTAARNLLGQTGPLDRFGGARHRRDRAARG